MYETKRKRPKMTYKTPMRAEKRRAADPRKKLLVGARHAPSLVEPSRGVSRPFGQRVHTAAPSSAEKKPWGRGCKPTPRPQS
jgi:hypothetical protein